MRDGGFLFSYPFFDHPRFLTTLDSGVSRDFLACFNGGGVAVDVAGRMFARVFKSRFLDMMNA